MKNCNDIDLKLKEFRNYISKPEYSKKFFYSDAENLNIRIKTHLKYSKSKIKWDDWIIASVKNKKINKVLDLGCGNGRFIFTLNKKKIGNDFLGIDISEEQVSNAKREVLKKKLKNIKFIESDVSDLKLGKDKYDLILCNHMLWHIEGLDNFLKKVSKLLAPGGFLLASTNSSDYMHEMYDLHSAICKKLKMPLPLQKKIRNSKFNLENGKGILSKRFQKVKKYTLKDELVFKKPVQILNYYKTFLMSLVKVYNNIPEEKWMEVYKSMKSHIEKTIKTTGTFKVTKNSGYFIAFNK